MSDTILTDDDGAVVRRGQPVENAFNQGRVRQRHNRLAGVNKLGRIVISFAILEDGPKILSRL